MIISTKGRYALKIMILLSKSRDGEYVPLKDIAGQVNTSLKYLESITSVLSKNGLVEAASGKGGGYRLVRSPDKYSVGEILRSVEKSIEPVSCVESGHPTCSQADLCSSLPIWKGLSDVVNNYLDSITLEEAQNNKSNNGDNDVKCTK